MDFGQDDIVEVQTQQVYDINEEFLITSLTGGQVGMLGWSFSNGGAGSSSHIAATAGHHGVLRLTTGSAQRMLARLSSSDTLANIDPAAIAYFGWIVRCVDVTNVNLRFGIGQDASNTIFGNAGVFFNYDAAVDTHWQTITRQASISTTNITTVTVSNNNWYLLEAYRLDNGNWTFLINGTLVFTHSDNLPTTMGIMIGGGNATSGAKNIDIDWARLRSSRLGQRFT